ncbi:hypothetical protein JCM10213_005704 [Rhodosporidiobolus nylandii]
MQYPHNNFDNAAFSPEGAASQASHGASAGAHPAGQPHPSSGAHPHPSSFPHHPHYPYPSGGRGYAFFSSFGWPRFGLYPHPAAFAGAGVPPLQPPFPPHPFPSTGDYRADSRLYRQLWRAQRGPRTRVWPFLLLAGGGFVAYRRLKGEIREVREGFAAASPAAAQAMSERMEERRGCGWRGWRQQENAEGRWRDAENRWKAWQAQQQQTVTPVEAPKPEPTKLV